MIKLFCDVCTKEVDLTKFSKLGCSWGCGRDLCHEDIYYDAYDQPACKFCAQSKLLKVRPMTSPRGAEKFLE